MKIIPQFDHNLLQRYDRPLPRYTSYPTAVKFREDFSLSDWRQGLQQSLDSNRPFSLYAHVPFCSSPCFYCGCSRTITRDPQRSETYLQALLQEIALVAQQIPAHRRKARQVHLGGGTPTFLTDEQLSRLWHAMADHFTLAEDGEYSIEIDPRSTSESRIEALVELGFNRMSFGVQDLDAGVQEAINRLQSADETFTQIARARALGVKSINVDLIYGLPRQTAATFGDTIDRVIRARPDRVAVYAYAHMPHLFKAQKQIDKYDLPAQAEKLQLLQIAIERFQAAGYDYIGLDHFALPDDELAIARRNNTLQRNFQGYATDSDCDMLGFGVTSIGKVGNVYYQNSKQEADYLASIARQELPIRKGYTLTADDCLRADTIMSLMCQGALNFDRFARQSGCSFHDYFADAIDELEAMQGDGLLTLTRDGLQVSPRGQLLLRNIAYQLDAYRQPTGPQRIHARAI